jgi:hypothetical protein
MEDNAQTSAFTRYYYPGALPTDFRRLVSFGILALNLYLLATVSSVWGFLVFGPFVLGGLYGTLRRSEPGIYVELRTDHVYANVPLFFGTRVSYSDIASVEFARYSLPEPLRQVSNLLSGFPG